MKVTILINKKEHIRNLPVSWDQVTFKTFLELDSCGQDIIKVIALLTRIEYETLLKAKIVDMDKVIAVLGFLNSPAQPVIPLSICGYPIPKDLAFEEVQQFVDLKTYNDETQGLAPLEKLKQYTVYCAVYACKAAFGHYDYKLAEKMKDQFLQAPCTEVMGIGHFTLARLIGLNLNINVSSPMPSTPWKKFKLVLINWRKLTAHIHHWFSWRKKQAELQKSLNNGV